MAELETLSRDAAGLVMLIRTRIAQTPRLSNRNNGTPSRVEGNSAIAAGVMR
jgi:hypothetical protein